MNITDIAMSTVIALTDEHSHRIDKAEVDVYLDVPAHTIRIAEWDEGSAPFDPPARRFKVTIEEEEVRGA